MENISSEVSAAISVSERVFFAVEALCVGSGDVRSRLTDAAIHLFPLLKEEFPAEMQSDFEWVIKQMSRFPGRHRNEGAFESTMAQIRNQTGAKIAARIFSIFVKLQDIRGNSLY